LPSAFRRRIEDENAWEPVRAGMIFKGKTIFRTPASRRQGMGKGKDDKAMGREGDGAMG